MVYSSLNNEFIWLWKIIYIQFKHGCKFFVEDIGFVNQSVVKTLEGKILRRFIAYIDNSCYYFTHKKLEIP